MSEKDFIEKISDSIHFGIREIFPNDLILLIQISAKVLLFLGVSWIFFVFFRLLIGVFLKKTFNKKTIYPFIYSLYQVRANRIISVMLTLLMSELVIDSIFQTYHPITNKVVTKVVGVSFVIFSAKLAFSILKAVEYHYQYIRMDYYQALAIRTVRQSVRSIGSFVFGIIALSIIFGIKGDTIFKYLSAFMAVFLLVFRDFILGFISGMHIATQKTYKVGDWVMIDKYDLEGTIKDISLLTTKVQNFDHTISTIPTYDLLNTEVKNFEVMKVGNKRRIKRSITFNINSFKFLDEELFVKLSEVNLISDYMEKMANSINYSPLSSTLSETHRHLELNYRQLTNIGVFRKYVEEYLRNNPNIDQTETILARQLNTTPHGLPLEIYCFTNYPDLLNFERVQADIFDHLLVASQTFELEITQLDK